VQRCAWDATTGVIEIVCAVLTPIGRSDDRELPSLAPSSVRTARGTNWKRSRFKASARLKSAACWAVTRGAFSSTGVDQNETIAGQPVPPKLK